ncbi:hypothetical protein QJS10_CPA06g01879 [Acorus calamus]|uniref:Uncharacterized protein n=1 Tax=Acorus calamus TaxID=4465 RepID=A0AAV9ENM9_ACOCL|nr:hypothetical protein QJS10_CPA06g01879 [Acorus calamus]
MGKELEISSGDSVGDGTCSLADLQCQHSVHCEISEVGNHTTFSSPQTVVVNTEPTKTVSKQDTTGHTNEVASLSPHKTQSGSEDSELPCYGNKVGVSILEKKADSEAQELTNHKKSTSPMKSAARYGNAKSVHTNHLSRNLFHMEPRRMSQVETDLLMLKVCKLHIV